jgi:hypothetical protein
MLRISALIPDKPAEDESPVTLYNLVYSIDPQDAEKATKFSSDIMNQVYKGRGYFILTNFEAQLAI